MMLRTIRTPKHQRGFTLVELIIYMGLLAIFLLVLTDIFVAILDTRTKSTTTSHVEQDGRYILARLTHSINQIPANYIITNPQQLGDTSSSLTYATGFFPFTYEINGNNLQYRFPNPFPPPAGFLTFNLNSSETTVSNLSFTKIGNIGGKETIKINFTVAGKATSPSGQETRTFTTTVARR